MISVTKEYYGTKRITAWAEEKDGKAGYSIKCADGHLWLPKEAFERSYQLLTAMDFSHALVAMKEDRTVARAGWNGKGMWIRLRYPGETSKMTTPYIYMKTVDDELVPWLCSQTDMLANDWGIVQAGAL